MQGKEGKEEIVSRLTDFLNRLSGGRIDISRVAEEGREGDVKREGSDLIWKGEKKELKRQDVVRT